VVLPLDHRDHLHDAALLQLRVVAAVVDEGRVVLARVGLHEGLEALGRVQTLMALARSFQYTRSCRRTTWPHRRGTPATTSTSLQLAVGHARLHHRLRHRLDMAMYSSPMPGLILKRLTTRMSPSLYDPGFKPVVARRRRISEPTMVRMPASFFW